MVNSYHEPFLGGAAMFLHLASKNMISTAYLSDTNEELIKTYRVVRDSVDELIQILNVIVVRDVSDNMANKKRTVYNYE
jgi:DNA adenine methylase